MDKERMEALQALQQALLLCDEATARLKSAKGWGIFDILGGGMISSLIKHGRIDDAKSLLIDLENQLSIVKKELGDLSMDLRRTLELHTISFAFDVFFDNIFSDIHTQSKINETLRALADLRVDLQDTITLINAQEE